MDLSMSSLGCFADGPLPEPTPTYPTFAAPTPINLSRNYTANTLTPGAIPSPLHFPSITPPTSPYYNLYSPLIPTPRVSPLCDPSYLRRLKSNPMFRDLQSLLQQECQQMQVPASLITTSWNLMHLQKTTPTSDLAPPTGHTSNTDTDQSSGKQVYLRHMSLQDKLLKVRIDPAISADGLSVENDYSTQVGNIEMDRYRALHSCPSDNIKVTINSYYDKERLNLADKTDEKLDKLIIKAEAMRKAVQNTNINQTTSVTTGHSYTTHMTQSTTTVPQCSQGASLLLSQSAEDKEKFNAVRKLKFNMCDNDNETVKVNTELDDDDYLNCSVNSEDFEIDEIDVETVEKEVPSVQATPTDRVNTPTTSVTPPPTHSDTQVQDIQEQDLLKQCLAESGLDTIQDTEAANINDNKQWASTNQSNLSVDSPTYPDSSTIDSPMSVDSVDSTTNSDNPSDVSAIPMTDHVTANIRKIATMATNSNNNNDLYHTPIHPGNYKFTNPDTLNMALSQMQQLCAGPRVNFTPEMRREITPSFTPESSQSIPKFSPLGEVFNNGFHSNRSYTQPGTNSAIDFSMLSGQSGMVPVRTGSGQKRKSPCDDTENQYNNNINQNYDNQVTTSNHQSCVTINDQEETSEPNPANFKTHRMLTADVTNCLSQWYQAHVTYPYPNEEEVQQLSQLTGITARQVKKWMANKRVRCFNTLSITGNQHPIKYKYQGRKKKADPQSDKENCDSTTNEKRANYTMLTEQAKHTLSQWYEAHLDNPYPTDEEKQNLSQSCGISVNQVKSWFANKRNRTNNTKRQVPNYFINKFPEYSGMVEFVGQKREEARQVKRRKLADFMYIQPAFYL